MINISECLKLVEDFLKKKSLRLSSTLSEMDKKYRFSNNYLKELESRIKYCKDENLALNSYLKELNESFDPMFPKNRLDAFHFEIQMSILSGKIGTINDCIAGFINNYFNGLFTKEDFLKGLPQMLEDLAIIYAKTDFISKLSNYPKDAEGKLKLNRFLKFYDKSSENHDYKIRWNGSTQLLARLFIHLSKKGWIENFQQDRNGPSTARVILNCFKIPKDGNEEAQFNSMVQNLKDSVVADFDEDEFNAEFGCISELKSTRPGT